MCRRQRSCQPPPHQQRLWHCFLHVVYAPCHCGRVGGPGHLSETQDSEFNYNNWPSSWGDEAAAPLPPFFPPRTGNAEVLVRRRHLSDWGYNGQTAPYWFPTVWPSQALPTWNYYDYSTCSFRLQKQTPSHPLDPLEIEHYPQRVQQTSLRPPVFATPSDFGSLLQRFVHY